MVVFFQKLLRFLCLFLVPLLSSHRKDMCLFCFFTVCAFGLGSRAGSLWSEHCHRSQQVLLLPSGALQSMAGLPLEHSGSLTLLGFLLTATATLLLLQS